MYTMNQSEWEKWERVGKTRVLVRATLNALVGRVVARGLPVTHPWFKVMKSKNEDLSKKRKYNV